MENDRIVGFRVRVKVKVSFRVRPCVNSSLMVVVGVKVASLLSIKLGNAGVRFRIKNVMVFSIYMWSTGNLAIEGLTLCSIMHDKQFTDVVRNENKILH